MASSSGAAGGGGAAPTAPGGSSSGGAGGSSSSSSERNAGASGSSGSGSGSLARDDSKWYFTSEQLVNSPSRKCGMDADQELMYRQRAANLIQDMGQRLQVSQLCINTAIVYMHRFYAFHSFTQFHRNSIAAAALFLAAKVEEQPRKLEHIIKVVHVCLGLEVPDPLKESYAEQAQDLVFNENVLLQTLGFDVAIDHPHTHVVKTCHLVKASKDLAQTSYFMASNSLHLTTMCLQYKPTVVACFCIHLACKWSRWEIPQSNEGRHWFHYVDKTVTLDLLKQLTDEFLHIFDRCPTRLKSKMKSIRADQAQTDDPSRRSSSNSSGMSGSTSSIPRGIDDAGSSTSSHHRSTSHSQHSHSKQSSGDPMLKAQSSSNHKIPSSSSSSTSRSRGDRPSSSSQQQQQLHQQQMMATSGHYGASGSSGKMQPLPHHSTSSRSAVPIPSSSSRAGYMHDATRDAKGRMLPTGASGSAASSLQTHSYGQSKMDRHSSSSSSSQKAQPPMMVHMDSKNPMSKSQSSMMPSLFGSGPDARAMKQPQTSYGSHPPSYSQSMSSRNNSLPSNESVTVPTQQQQFKNQLQQQLASGTDSTFRLLDDSSRMTDPMQLCTPPKQSKPSSIFSPDWKDTQAEGSNANLPNTVGSGKSRTQGHSSGLNPGLTKPIKESPSSKEKKQVLQSYLDPQQSKQRSDTPKKERRSEMMGGHQNQKSVDKKPSLSSLKRSLEASSSTVAPVNPLPPISHDPAELMGINKLSSTQTAGKRSLPNSEQVRQEDGTDFRESKVRKMEPTSPSDNLFASTFDSSNTFDKLDDGFSMFSFGDPASLLSQPLLSDSKPVNISSKSSFSSTINGIETNPALVSSLLKESLCSNDSKFTTNSSGSISGATAGNVPVVPGSDNTDTGLLSLSSVVPTSGAPLMSVSNMPSTATVVSSVPEIVKQEPSSIDSAPSTISNLLAQPSVPLVSTVQTTVPSASGTISTAATASSDLRTLTGDPLSAVSKDEEQLRSKSEKKKKKDKHKHKEKDKSKDKDREDRKKHKKDKDRHRDRDKSDTNSDPSLVSPPPGPIKIKLPKDKLNLPSLSDSTPATNAPASDTGLKIKIPKDRLSGSSSLGGSAAAGPTTSGGTSSAPVPPPNPLKLKISKDKIEHYNVSTGGAGGYNNGSGHANAGPHHSHSSKKKDRDKERDKSKSNKALASTLPGDYNKQNGSIGSATGSQGSNSSNKSSSNKLSVPSAQQSQHSLYNANQMGTTSQTVAGLTLNHHPASFDYMQHAQAPTLQQQQQYFNQFGTFNVQQQQQQMLINNSAIKMPGSNLGTTLPPPYYYGSGNPNNGGSSGKK